jgi:hypothetical protein
VLWSLRGQAKFRVVRALGLQVTSSRAKFSYLSYCPDYRSTVTSRGHGIHVAGTEPQCAFVGLGRPSS